MSRPCDRTNPPAPARGLYGQRPSASADASRRSDFADAWSLSPRQRMVLALALGDDARSWALRCGFDHAGR
jgi:hypothetical protein